jgi:hypothetical protein
MIDLIVSAKLIMMFALIGTMIALSHFGGQPARVRRTIRR